MEEYVRKSIIVVALLLAATGAAVAFAADAAQTACPVSGEAVDKTEYVDWQGQRVYFCCPKCVAAFKKDPDKYFEQMAADGVVLESVQTHDPVCNMEHGAEGIHADYKGRRVYFCSDYCKKTFEKDPAKYLNKLPGEQPKGQS